MKSLRVEFENFNGSRLGARIDMPKELKPEHFALFAHCFTCTKNIKSIDNINKALTEHRIAVLRFDFTGIGESDGDFAETNFTTNVQDLIAAAEFLRNKYESPKILIGHSLGGAAVLQAASSIPSSFIKVNEKIKTITEGIYVIGDVNAVFAHSTIAESLNNLFANVENAYLFFYRPQGKTPYKISRQY